ncbi:MAG: glycosyltransferase [Clostridiales bacterium]|nr:glycosyltransferase [Clostridiales bacterium]
MTPASISVVIITYNEEKNIRPCLDSLMALDYPKEKHEILVVDASTDETPRIVQRYEKVRLIQSAKGFSQQRNAGLEAAKFDIVAFTDADCVIPPDWLRVIDRAFREERVAGVGGNAFPPPATNRFGLWTACVGHPAGGAIGFDANVERARDGVDFVAGCNSAFRKSALIEVGGFDPRFFDGGEDVDVSRRLRERGYFLDYVPDLTVYHKPRRTLVSYLRWNIGVGITKFNLFEPSLLKLIFQPFFPLWFFILATLGVVFFVKNPLLSIFLWLGLWISLIFALWLAKKPFPLLLKRRKKVGVHLLSCLTIVPVLILLRQICINIGQLKKWARVTRL